MTATRHVVHCLAGAVHYDREMDHAYSDQESVIRDLIFGQFYHPVEVLAFNKDEGWCRDVSEDIAHAVRDRAAAAGCPLTLGTLNFLQARLGFEATNHLEAAE